MVGTWRKKLKILIQNRKMADDQVLQFEQIRVKINKQILKIMQKHTKDKIELAGYSTVIVQPVNMVLDEAYILFWYKENGLKPPLKKIFDQDKFEKDIRKKKVPASILKKASTVNKGHPYIRITELKK